jgi:hypothetical protein
MTPRSNPGYQLQVAGLPITCLMRGACAENEERKTFVWCILIQCFWSKQKRAHKESLLAIFGLRIELKEAVNV